MPKTRGAWIALAMFISIVLAVFTWFFFVSPKFDEKSILADQEAGLVLENNELETRVTTLRAQFARIDEFRAELAQLQVRVPTTADTEDLVAELDAAASKHDVILQAVAAETAQSLIGDTVEVPEPEPSATASDSDDSQGAVDAEVVPETAPAPGWAVDGPNELVTLPYKIDIDADYADAIAFINELQTKEGRYFLLSNPVVTALDIDGEDVDQELNLTFTLYTFVLTEETGPEVVEEDTEPGQARTSKKNNFAVTD